jgi:outer membrane protein OmpA-like peptidoglycan-associated protein
MAIRGSKALIGVVAAALAASATAGCGVATVAAGRRIASTPHCSDFFTSIDFVKGSEDLTRSAGAVIRDAGAHIKGCRSVHVEVSGLTDDRGVTEDARVLSRRRAQHLTAILANAGLPPPVFKPSALGQAGAVPDDDRKPMVRRVIMTIRFDP